MGLLESLIGIEPEDPGDPLNEMRRLASLLMTEIRLYNADLGLGDEAGLPEALVDELVKAHRLYTRRVGESESAREVFIVEAARVFAAGETDVVAAALEAELGRGSAVRPR
jgi:hypothetical protein